MTYIKKILSVLLMFTVLISAVLVHTGTNASAASITTAYINGTGVNVREGPGTNYNKIEPKGIGYRQVTVVQTVGDWLQVKYMNGGVEKNGYIKYDSSYIYLTANDPDLDFASQLGNFPESYREALTALHNIYPNWKFVPDIVNSGFEEAVQLQMAEMRKQVQLGSHPISWRSMGKGAYDWNTGKWIDTNGGWTGASREVIRYYMDPRNFLNADEIYMFLSQSYGNVTYTEEGVKSIVNGTFMNTPEYITVILNAGKQAGISPYMIASKIRQEQGTGIDKDGNVALGPLISGTYPGFEGYYNFFNWGASGSNDAAVIQNGLAYAKEQGWNTIEKSIVGGAKLLADGYVEVGQDTYYYQDFNVHFTGKLWHQYAQAVHDARSKGLSLKSEYKDKTDYTLVFRIPVFKEMPAQASPRPIENESQNNYYFNNISVSGLMPTFDRYTYYYDLQVAGDTIADVNVPAGATLDSATQFNLAAGNNTVVLRVKAQTGYTNDYSINVYATQNATLYINSNSVGAFPSGVAKGDINGDGKISVSDMATIRLQLLGEYNLTGDAFTAADINSDGKISASDMAAVRLHLLGKYTIA